MIAETEKKLSLTIDGRSVTVPEGATILEAAKELGIEIPTLCYHKALTPYGSCRICLVEIENRGRSQLVASCAYPVVEGLVVKTDTVQVNDARKVVIELQLQLFGVGQQSQNLVGVSGLEKCV